MSSREALIEKLLQDRTVTESNALARAKAFLPKIAEANAKLEESAATCDPIIHESLQDAQRDVADEHEESDGNDEADDEKQHVDMVAADGLHDAC